jgi:hypothetical protein
LDQIDPEPLSPQWKTRAELAFHLVVERALLRTLLEEKSALERGFLVRELCSASKYSPESWGELQEFPVLIASQTRSTDSPKLASIRPLEASAAAVTFRQGRRAYSDLCHASNVFS